MVAGHVEAYRAVLAARLEAAEAAPISVEEVQVGEDLGVVVVTSVLPLHPSCALLEAVLATHIRQEPLLRSCRLRLIVADCPKLAPSGRLRYKSGQVQPDDCRRYREYLDQVEELCRQGTWPFEGWRLVRMPVFGGFGLALKAGLQILADEKVPFCLVLQHDRILKRPFGVADILLTMKQRPETFRYIGLASNSSRGALARYRTMKIPVQEKLSSTANGRTLVPLPFWYDSTHVANVQFYLDFVFGWHSMEGTQYEKPFRLKTGDFPEDKLGNAMLAFYRLHGMKVHRLFGCYLLDDAETIYCRHIHGRKINSGASRALENYVDQQDVAEEEDLGIDDNFDESDD